MLRINNIKIPVSHEPEDIKSKVCKKLRIDVKSIKTFKISKKSIDARDKENVFYVYSADIEILNESKYLKYKDVSQVNEVPYVYKRVSKPIKNRPVITGSGPAGLFAGLILAEAGLSPIIIERGKAMDERRNDVEIFFNSGKLDENSNIQFGEGGAGTFSDGKLTTGIKDRRISFVLNEFVTAGAPTEILYLSKPHIGTDRLVSVIKNIREKIIELGGEFRFSSCMTDICHENGRLTGVQIKTGEDTYFLETEIAILAIGHSARDTVEMLTARNIKTEQKPFAVGLRIEHKRQMINEAQYGSFSRLLPAADYKLAVSGVYTFCMCPGGTVVPAASEAGHLAVNGMSLYNRNAENSNSAVLVSVSPDDGIKFQREIEKRAFIAGGGNYNAPVQLLGDFLQDRMSTGFHSVYPSYKPGVTLADMREILSENIIKTLKHGITEMDKKLSGFTKYDSVLTAVESRSSSPVRICRDKSFNSNIKGLIPCGEGCGYAGGIMSAAVDGIKCAEAIIDIFIH